MAKPVGMPAQPHLVSAACLTHISRSAAEQLDAMIAEIVESSPYGIVILYIERGKVIKITPGLIGKSEKINA